MRLIVEPLHVFGELIRQHRVQALFIAIAQRLLIVPALELYHGQRFVELAQLCLHRIALPLEQLQPLGICRACLLYTSY